ncbi:MAG: DUF262 domain-containing HNH endonuclease family protein [Streptococcaceae bacterium]|jgi:uncharacterized protein with ParB-like and HNH nuclease domain|nr:DUF262 domain-containing HNH endonuclease family protein [Streptococcaceae bacterium]
MKAEPGSIKEFISTQKRTFVIPVFQRQYTWTIQNCETLIKDIENIILTNKRHYFGNIVFYVQETNAISAESIIALIDGQQRVTTIMLLLAAIAQNEEKETKESLYKTYLQINSEETIKLKQTLSDRDMYDAIIREETDKYSDSQKDCPTYKNFEYFSSIINKHTAEEWLKAIDRLDIVSLDLDLSQDSESPQIIFESMNSTGKPLNTAELMCNFLLMDISLDAQEQYYKDNWLIIVERLRNSEEIQKFLNTYLTLKNKVKTVNGNEYTDYKNTYKKFVNNTKEGIEDLRKYSEYYQYILAPIKFEKNKELSEILQDIDELQISAIFPFILLLFDFQKENKISYEEIAKILNIFVNIIMRIRISNSEAGGSYLQSFVNHLIKKIEKSKDFDESQFEEILFAYSDSRLIIDDKDFKDSFTKFDAYNSKNKNYLFRKLEFKLSNDRENWKPKSIEHILPKTLTPYWKAKLSKEDDEAISLHSEFVHKIGNLAPMNQKDNSANGQKPYSEKKKLLKASSWKVTQNIPDEYGDWTIESIKKRTKKLSELAVKVWKIPKRGK